MTTKTNPSSPKTPPVRPGRAVNQRDRLSCRIDPRIKQRAEEAAILLGQDLTAFTETALDEKARSVFAREEEVALSERDFALFLELIENPKPVGARLKAAAGEYKTVRREHPELNW